MRYQWYWEPYSNTVTWTLFWEQVTQDRARRRTRFIGISCSPVSVIRKLNSQFSINNMGTRFEFSVPGTCWKSVMVTWGLWIQFSLNHMLNVWGEVRSMGAWFHNNGEYCETQGKGNKCVFTNLWVFGVLFLTKSVHAMVPHMHISDCGVIPVFLPHPIRLRKFLLVSVKWGVFGPLWLLSQPFQWMYLIEENWVCASHPTLMDYWGLTTHNPEGNVQPTPVGRRTMLMHFTWWHSIVILNGWPMGCKIFNTMQLFPWRLSSLWHEYLQKTQRSLPQTDLSLYQASPNPRSRVILAKGQWPILSPVIKIWMIKSWCGCKQSWKNSISEMFPACYLMYKFRFSHFQSNTEN